MNLFFLHLDPKICVTFYFNKHIKIILEATQMLYTAQWVENSDDVWIERHNKELEVDRPFRKAFMNHPTTRWVRQHLNNYLYCCELAIELCLEYTRRYKKEHKLEKKIRWLKNNPPSDIEKTNHAELEPLDNCYVATVNVPHGCTPVPLAMPEQYRSPDLVKSYRFYYLSDKYWLATKEVPLDRLLREWNMEYIED